MGFDFPQTALVKKIFIHSSQYDSCHLKDQTSIPVKPDIFQVLFQPLIVHSTARIMLTFKK